MITLMIFILIGLPTGSTRAADISVTLKLDRTTAGLGDTITMVVSLSGSQKTDREPVIKGLKDFEVVRGSTSRRMEIINGKVTSGIDYHYLIQPLRPGAFQIGPAEIKSGGRLYKSEPVTLSINRGALSDAAGAEPIFLTTNLSQSTAYVEEQLLYILKLFLRVRVSDISLELPEVEHLTLKQLGKPVEYQSVRNKNTYRVIEVRYSLIPESQGNYGIPPAKMRMTVYESRRGTNRSFNSFFAPGRLKTITSQPMELKVLPLPETGQPEDFSGLVGDFKIDSVLEPSEITFGESAALTVSLSGRGNINRMPDMKGPDLDWAKIYADQPIFKAESDSKGLKGSKVMKWAIVPEKDGSYQLPSISVNYYNPEKHKYIWLRTDPKTLTVIPGKKTISIELTQTKSPVQGTKREVQELGRDILPVHTSMKNLGRGAGIEAGSLYSWLVILAPFMLYAIVFVTLRLQKRALIYDGDAKARKAAKNFLKLYHREGFEQTALGTAIRSYLNDRFQLSLGVLTPEEAAEILKSRGINPDTASRLREILTMIDLDTYSGRKAGPLLPQDILGEIPELIKRIEREAP